MAQPADLDWSPDGAPRSRRFDDVYFSRADGLAESRAVFLAGCGLPEAWAGRDRFTVGELGFGTGPQHPRPARPLARASPGGRAPPHLHRRRLAADRRRGRAGAGGVAAARRPGRAAAGPMAGTRRGASTAWTFRACTPCSTWR
ncbi:MAG: hypothetical protein WDM92_12630 [Caulobacteraceae bacterium]